MKAITLKQPWASMLAFGVTTYEVKTWKTSYKGPIAIHAAKRPRHGIQEQLMSLDRKTFISMSNAIQKPSLHGINHYRDLEDRLPFGAIIAVANLDRCVPVSDVEDGLQQQGRYSPGFWAWVFSNPTPIYPPIPAVGQLKVWDWKP